PSGASRSCACSSRTRSRRTRRSARRSGCPSARSARHGCGASSGSAAASRCGSWRHDAAMTDRDERLLEELRQLVREVDPVPDDVTSFARAALGWRRIDAELAELLSDSVLESEALAGVRGVARARVVSFRASDLELDVEI